MEQKHTTTSMTAHPQAAHPKPLNHPKREKRPNRTRFFEHKYDGKTEQVLKLGYNKMIIRSLTDWCTMKEQVKSSPLAAPQTSPQPTQVWQPDFSLAGTSRLNGPMPGVMAALQRALDEPPPDNLSRAPYYGLQTSSSDTVTQASMDVIQMVSTQVVKATLGIDDPTFQRWRGYQLTGDHMVAFHAAGYQNDEIEAIGAHAQIPQQLYTYIPTTRLRAEGVARLVAASNAPNAGWILNHYNGLAIRGVAAIERILGIIPNAQEHRAFLTTAPDLDLNFALWYPQNIANAADWQWLFQNWPGNVNHNAMRAMINQLTVVQWRALIAGGITEDDLDDLNNRNVAWATVANLVILGLPFAHVLAVTAPGWNGYTLAQLGQLTAGAAPPVAWLQNHSQAIRTSMDAGRSAAAVLQMAAYNWTDQRIEHLEWFTDTATGVDNNAYLVVRNQSQVNVGWVRAGHYALRHTFRHFAIATVDAQNSLWPNGTTIHHVLAMAQRAVLNRNAWQGGGPYTWRVRCPADQQDYDVRMSWDNGQSRLTQMYPTNGPNLITYTQAQMQQFFNVKAL